LQIPDIENRLTDLEAKVQALAENQEAIMADAAKLPESLALNFRLLSRNLEAKFTAQDREIEALDRKVDGLAADVNHLKTDVDHLKTDVGDLKTDVAAILKILGEQFKPQG
jgi:outer membrane murein-binding lipoprotein Lpp